MRPRRRPVVALLGALTGTGALVAGSFLLAPGSQAAPAAAMAAAPYLYQWGSPPKATDVMSATGVRWFTLAFILDGGGCNPKWDGDRSLTGSDRTLVNQIRAAGGDVIPSFGGYSGNKLGQKCSSASKLAAAYQKVIDTYSLKAIDIDIEAGEVGSATVRQRVVDALKTVKRNNSGLKVYVTIGTGTSGPEGPEADLIERGGRAGLDVAGWTIMPFDYGSNPGDMGKTAIKAANGLKNQVKSAYGYSDSEAYRHIGISSMNGKDDDGHVTNQGDFREMLSYAQAHHLARLTFWSVNRDRSCGSGSDGDSCSGISQSKWEFTKIIAGYQG